MSSWYKEFLSKADNNSTIIEEKQLFSLFEEVLELNKGTLFSRDKEQT